VVHELLRRKPGLEGHVIDGDGRLVKYVSVFLNGRDIRHLDGLDTTVTGKAEISIFPPVAGG
jgi:molybdopterin synthase sulfur carrier subunit